jgi:hypothetical protein
MIQELTTSNVSIPKGNYLLIQARGIINSLDEHKQHSANIADEVLKTDYSKVLLDERDVHYRVRLISVHDIVNFYLDSLQPEVLTKQMALVSNEQNYKNATFWETVAYNRGYNFKVFTSYYDGVQWLLHKKDSPSD